MTVNGTAAARPGLFEPCMAFVKGWEGGWSDHPADPGGLTRWGVTLATVVARALDFNRDGASDRRDLEAMTEAQAEAFYRAEYWTVTGCPDLPGPLALLHFDAAVNQGPGRAARFLQAVAGVPQDGKIGPQTRAAVVRRWTSEPERFLRDYAVARALSYSGLVQIAVFGRGWFRRLFAAHAVATLAWESMQRGEAPARAMWQAVGRVGEA